MKKKFFPFFLFIFILILLFSPSLTIASEFTSAYLRLDNQGANAALSGTVCGKPSSVGAGTEGKIVIAFPSGFTISSTTSNWTTSTSNLPADSTAWPGIGATASSVSGQGVTFASSDLTSSVLYCFNFTGGSSTTGSAGNDKVGFITTQTAASSTIDLTTYAVSIVSSDLINITASVDPQVSDLPIAIESTTAGTQFPQNTTLSYQITYGSNTVAPIPLTIQAEWSEGTISGNPTPSVDILDYVVGSASNAYGSTSPVIDTSNKTITWTISSFPGATTGQTVTFQLKTNESYTGGSVVDFTISARATSGNTVTPDVTLSQSYLFASTPSTVGGPGDGRSDQRSDGRSDRRINLLFHYIQIRSISESQARIFAATSAPAKMRLTYGTSKTNLNKEVSFNNFSLTNFFNLKDLEADTTYYFRIYATDAFAKTILSDIFTFKTAVKESVVEIEEKSLVVTSKNNIIFDTISDLFMEKAGKIIIPQSSDFQFQFYFKQKQSVQKVKVTIYKKVLANNNVLGIQALATGNNVSLLEIRPGVYVANLRSGNESGYYELFVSFLDNDGNLIEKKLVDVEVTNPFSVYNKEKQPIERARVFLHIYNYNLKVYTLLSSSNLNIKNPSFANTDGIVDIVLPKGKYKANISDIGYKEQTVVFEIADGQDSSYPIIYLEKDTFNVFHIIKYYLVSFNDVFMEATNSYLASLKISVRFFDLIAALIMACFVILTLFAFSHRHSIAVSSFFSYFFYLLNHKQRNKKYISGVVVSEKNNPVSAANVYLTNAEDEQIVKSARTNGKGEFFFSKKDGEFSLMVMKKGFESTPQLPYREKSDLSFKIYLKENDLKLTIIDRLSHLLHSVLGMSYEVLLFASLFFEILFMTRFGIVKTLPFLTISVLNMVLWILVVHHRKNHYET